MVSGLLFLPSLAFALNCFSAIPEHTATQQERYPNLSSTSALCTPRRPRYIQSMPAISSLSRRPFV